MINIVAELKDVQGGCCWRIFRVVEENGIYGYAVDAGCSDNTPFEHYRQIGSYNRFDRSTFDRFENSLDQEPYNRQTKSEFADTVAEKMGVTVDEPEGAEVVVEKPYTEFRMGSGAYGVQQSGCPCDMCRPPDERMCTCSMAGTEPCRNCGGA